MTWREYHEATKHSVESLSRIQHTLDWRNMPDPFRHYEGAPLLDLPADPPEPAIPALETLQGTYGDAAASDGPGFLSQLLFHAAAISASKRVISTGHKYALRVNPSSGNLHPTEFHFVTRGVKDWPDGIYHYRPSSHMAEQRATGDFTEALAAISAPIVFVLTSIAWREEWKYLNRAYRYCLHDLGHAWESIALAARAMGCETQAVGEFPDDEIARLCRINHDEWPMLLLGLRGPGIRSGVMDRHPTVWSEGEPNPLSSRTIHYPLIDEVHAATKIRMGSPLQPFRALTADRAGAIELPVAAPSVRGFGEVVRARRSALDFLGGSASISLAQLSAVLGATAQPLRADFAAIRIIQLYMYAHRVDGLDRGVYRYWLETHSIETIRQGDQRVAAAGLSLGQDLAGNACAAFSMIADLDRVTTMYGDRGYRYAHFEAGAIGQRMYIAAEAVGLGATGIGAFYDDDVNRYLHLASSEGQVVYHFALGHPVPDPRLSA